MRSKDPRLRATKTRRRHRMAPTAAAFGESSVAGLVGWFKADAIPSLNDGDTLTSWPDSTAAGNNLGTVGGTPTWETNEANGLPVVRFAAASSEYVLGTPASLVSAGVGNGATFTVISAAKPNDTAASKTVACWAQAASNNDTQILRLDTAEKQVYSVNDGTTTNAHAASTNALSVAAFNVATWKITDERNLTYYLNGTANGVITATGTDLGSVDPDRFGIGAFVRTAPVDFFDGDIAEVLIYTGALSDANRQVVERYLGTKYNISVA